MKSRLKKILLNALVLMMAMLPLRNGLAMPMESPSPHCADAVAVEMPMMNHAGHHMPASDLALPTTVEDGAETQKTACTCCPQCDAQCTGCVHISAAITFDFPQLVDAGAVELVSVIADSLLTRTVSPPARPPLKL